MHVISYIGLFLTSKHRRKCDKIGMHCVIKNQGQMHLEINVLKGVASLYHQQTLTTATFTPAISKI
jgi:hypothetical protein